MAKKPTYEQLEQRVKELAKLPVGQNRADKIEVSDITIAWDSKQGTCTFENLPVAMMWVDTTLAGLMLGVQAMVGTERFGLALQSEGRKSVEADWKVISQFSDFQDGFKAIANIAAVAGWGNWNLISLDMEKKEALFRIRDSWEGRYQKALGVCWGSGMLAGKMAGYCSKLFETNCWANQTAFIPKEGEHDEFVVTPSERSIEQEIENLLATDEATRADMAVALQKLQKEVAERRQTEEAHRESEQKYRQLFENETDAIMVFDAETKLFEDANEATLDLYGYTKAEFLKLTPEDLSAEPEKTRRAVRGIVDRTELETIPLRYQKKKDGTIIPAEITSGAFEMKGRKKIIGAVRDISERIQSQKEKEKLEARLQRAEKMEALGTLAGGVAHDLNNVLGGLVSYPDLMLMDLPEDSPLREPILTMKNSGKKAAAIVQDLLTLARRGVVTTEVSNLNDIVADYLKSPEYERLKSFHPGVSIETGLETNLLNVVGSPTHLSKTVMNLVSNAVEALPGGGKVTISTKNQHIDRPIAGYDEVQEGDYVVLSVVDNGIGISPQDAQRIFEPFYTKKVMGKSGTGLGMAVVWGTVKDHKGYIELKSTEGEGTRVDLYFPVTRKELEKDKAATSIEEFMGSGERILVVDDVQEQREIAAVLLRQLGYSIHTVSSGEEAVEYMKTDTADLLVLDMIMDPGIDGLDTYKKIIELHPGQKAIIASGFSETDRVKETERLGAGQYIKKPYTLEKIGVAVKAELEE